MSPLQGAVSTAGLPAEENVTTDDSRHEPSSESLVEVTVCTVPKVALVTGDCGGGFGTTYGTAKLRSI